MYEQIEKSLSTYIQLEKFELDYLISQLEVQYLKRKELVLTEGQICKNAYFINKGSLRIYHNIDGSEITGQFFFENDWYTNYASFLSQKPSLLNIEALEKTELLVLPKVALENLFVAIPKFERFGRLIAENAFLGLQQRTEMYTNQSPEERYIKLLNDRPNIFQRVPQHYIASYLGIKPPSLSRIRKRILSSM
jgi:CRP/FNR family transcriptional regulator, anaerobic regulatory protein